MRISIVTTVGALYHRQMYRAVLTVWLLVGAPRAYSPPAGDGVDDGARHHGARGGRGGGRHSHCCRRNGTRGPAPDRTGRRLRMLRGAVRGVLAVNTEGSEVAHMQCVVFRVYTCAHTHTRRIPLTPPRLPAAASPTAAAPPPPASRTRSCALRRTNRRFDAKTVRPSSWRMDTLCAPARVRRLQAGLTFGCSRRTTRGPWARPPTGRSRVRAGASTFPRRGGGASCCRRGALVGGGGFVCVLSFVSVPGVVKAWVVCFFEKNELRCLCGES